MFDCFASVSFGIGLRIDAVLDYEFGLRVIRLFGWFWWWDFGGVCEFAWDSSLCVGFFGWFVILVCCSPVCHSVFGFGVGGCRWVLGGWCLNLVFCMRVGGVLAVFLFCGG